MSTAPPYYETASSTTEHVLNVGGVWFYTSAETLQMRAPSFFSALCRAGAPCYLFIDRDPTHFRHVLNYLRGSQASLPRDQASLEELREEADFYMLPNLVARIDAALVHYAGEPLSRIASAILSLRQ